MNDITLREYFAAHAPPEPQEWFIPKDPGPFPQLRPGATYCLPCRDETGACDGSADCEEIRAYRVVRDKWIAGKDKARCVEWPWAWADAMIKEMRTGYCNLDGS